MTENRTTYHPGIDNLSPDDQEGFAWLGILHEDAVIWPAMATVLWSLPEVEARQRLKRLQEAGLVQPVDDEAYCLDGGMHKEAQRRLSEQMLLAEAHACSNATAHKHRIAYGTTYPTMATLAST